MKKILRDILIKPAGPDCNLRCEYCFYLQKGEMFGGHRQHRMSDEVLEELVRQMMSQTSDTAVFNWQGGEPTLMGLEFFEKAIEFQKKYGRQQAVGNTIQTNGTLIDENWAQFLREYKFLIGLSLDGPEHVHDHYRKTGIGKGTFAKVINSAKLLLDAGCEVNALSVVNDYSVNFPEEIFNFLRDIGLNYMQFIPAIEPHAIDPKKVAPFTVPPKKYGEFLCVIFDLWMNSFVDGMPTTSVRFFESALYSYVDLNPPECSLMPECGVYVVVEHNGDVYSCDFFVDPQWKLGNIMQHSLTEMLNSPRQTEFGRLKKNLTNECKNCPWLRHCWGGCTKNRLNNPENQNLDYLCSAYKTFFSYADDRLKKMADEWKQKQGAEQAAIRQKIRQMVAEGKLVVGRNDPCPCGSGKKFKKCCGMSG
ncbi:MAG: anaerobic sulfatase maturase [Calditrichaeota bacterium]|nr:anaerobic sulfatase maturase [Calditrichota bacterium]